MRILAYGLASEQTGELCKQAVRTSREPLLASVEQVLAELEGRYPAKSNKIGP